MKLEELHIYQMAMTLGEEIWKLAESWSYYVKDTIGKQLVRAVDSIAANYCGRLWEISLQRESELLLLFAWFFKRNRHLANKGEKQNLISIEKFEELNQLCESLSVKLNNYIKTIGKQQQ